MSGNFSRHNLLNKFRKWLKVVNNTRETAREDVIKDVIE